jgi:hypothetical protein
LRPCDGASARADNGRSSRQYIRQR